MSRRGDPDRRPRGRSESPPMPRSGRKKTKLERIALNKMHEHIPVLQPPRLRHIANNDYAVAREVTKGISERLSEDILARATQDYIEYAIRKGERDTPKLRA